MRSIRNILICVLVLFVSIIFDNLLFGVVSAILLFLVFRYRDRIKELENKSG